MWHCTQHNSFGRSGSGIRPASNRQHRCLRSATKQVCLASCFGCHPHVPNVLQTSVWHAHAANIKVLVYSNVETFITFRSSTPLVLSVFDYIFLGRKLPGGRSIFSILLLIMSCSGYTYYDQGFKLEAYTWLCVW
jgi:hypothetical protein